MKKNTFLIVLVVVLVLFWSPIKAAFMKLKAKISAPQPPATTQTGTGG